MRTLFILVFVVFLSACSSKLAYNNLDWWVYWYLDDYIELKEDRKKSLMTTFRTGCVGIKQQSLGGIKHT